MGNTTVTDIIKERDLIIMERRHALSRWANAEKVEQLRVFYEFVQPLNDQLLVLNRKLGI